MLHHEGVTIRDLLRVWFSWKRQAFFAAALTVVAITGMAYLSSPRYTARAMIILLPRTSEGSVITSGSEEKKLAPVSLEDVNTEIELMKCNDVAAATVNSFLEQGTEVELGYKTGNPVARIIRFGRRLMGGILSLVGLTEQASEKHLRTRSLQNALTIQSKALSNAIQISLTSRDPVTAAKVLNRFLEVYIDHHNRVYTAQHGRVFIEEQAGFFKRKLDSAERALDDYRRQKGIIDPELQGQKMVLLAAELEEEEKRLEIAEHDIRSDIGMLKKALAGDPQNIVVTPELRKTPEIAEIEKALVPLLMKKAELSATYTMQSREYTLLESQIKSFYLERTREFGQILAGKALELENLSRKRTSLREKIRELKSTVMDLNRKKIVINEQQRSSALLQQNFLLYSGKMEDARIAAEKLGSNIFNVTIADYAEPPELRTSPDRILLLLVAIFLGFFALVITPFIIELVDMRIKTPADVTKALDLPVLCSIPEREIPGQHERGSRGPAQSGS